MKVKQRGYLKMRSWLRPVKQLKEAAFLMNVDLKIISVDGFILQTILYELTGEEKDVDTLVYAINLTVKQDNEALETIIKGGKS